MISISESVELNMSPTEKSWEVKVGLKMIGKKSWEFCLIVATKTSYKQNIPLDLFLKQTETKAKCRF